MAREDVTSTSWSAGLALSADVTVQAVKGDIMVSVEATPAAADGLVLSATPGRLQAVVVRSGSTLKWRKAGGADATLAIEAVG